MFIIFLLLTIGRVKLTLLVDVKRGRMGRILENMCCGNNGKFVSNLELFCEKTGEFVVLSWKYTCGSYASRGEY